MRPRSTAQHPGKHGVRKAVVVPSTLVACSSWLPIACSWYSLPLCSRISAPMRAKPAVHRLSRCKLAMKIASLRPAGVRLLFLRQGSIYLPVCPDFSVSAIIPTVPDVPNRSQGNMGEPGGRGKGERRTCCRHRGYDGGIPVRHGRCHRKVGEVHCLADDSQLRQEMGVFG